MDLIRLGWNEFFKKESTGSNTFYGRISVEHKSLYKIFTEFGEMKAVVTGKMKFNSQSSVDLPVVGDWVVFTKENDLAVIQEVLPRKSKFSRKVAGIETSEQIVASNIDHLFIVTSLNQDLNLRRLERYLTLAWDGGANPVIILSKADLADDLDEIITQVETVAWGVPIHVTSSLDDIGFDELGEYFEGNKTIAVLGSSGVGKSTLINKLLGNEVLKVSEIGEYKDKGKHTTTHRELLLLPKGGIIIDTPGMREIQIWEGSEGLEKTFADVEEFAMNCKFSDCKHESEPNCGINEALRNGNLDEARLKSYKKLQREIAYQERKQNEGLHKNSKNRWKGIC
ncbi:MAG: ribosome small subunit-dependent GTPase A [Calditrichaeota bacterium]|nr:MAG: ribosome small subunit-dependent GTPase A [Calditrichota bacterium]